jgi:hypothetical protein
MAVNWSDGRFKNISSNYDRENMRADQTAPKNINRLVAMIPNAQTGFRLVFSATPFPGYAAKLEWRREEYGGNWYYSPQFDIEGWLCPALFRYFDKAPSELYCRAEPKTG